MAKSSNCRQQAETGAYTEHCRRVREISKWHRPIIVSISVSLCYGKDSSKRPQYRRGILYNSYWCVIRAAVRACWSSYANLVSLYATNARLCCGEVTNIKIRPLGHNLKHFNNDAKFRTVHNVQSAFDGNLTGPEEKFKEIDMTRNILALVGLVIEGCMYK